MLLKSWPYKIIVAVEVGAIEFQIPFTLSQTNKRDYYIIRSLPDRNHGDVEIKTIRSHSLMKLSDRETHFFRLAAVIIKW